MDSRKLSELLIEVWSAGFRIGHHNGSDAQCAHEWGERSGTAQEPFEAWNDEVKPYLDSPIQTFDVLNPEHWKGITP